MKAVTGVFSCLKVGILFLLVTPLGYSTTVVWDGDTDTTITNGNNWVGGSAPSLTTTNDIASFTGGTAPINQPTWSLGVTNGVDGIVSGDNYAPTIAMTAVANRVVSFGSTGIDTGTQLLTITGTGVAALRNFDFDITADQTWTIGSGGMTFTNGVNGNFRLTNTVATTAVLTKDGSGTLTLPNSNNFTGSWVILAGTVLTTGNVSNNPGSLTTVFTLNGATATLQQNAAIGNRGISIGSNGGTFVATNGNQSWTNAGQFAGTGNFTIDLTQMGASAGGLAMQAANAGYTGHLTISSGGGTGFNRVTANDASGLGDGSNSNHHVTVNSSDAVTNSLTVGNGINLSIGTLDGNSNARIATATGAANVGTLTVNQHQAGTYSGVFSVGATAGATFNLVKAGTATLTLGGNSSASTDPWNKGAVTLNAGKTIVAANNAFGTSVVTVALNSATLANNATGRSLANTVTTSGTSSTIETAGTFTLATLNATNGLNLSLSSGDLLDVTGTFTGSTAASGLILNLEGGYSDGAHSIINFGASAGLQTSDFALSSTASSLYSLDSVTIGANSVSVGLTSFGNSGATDLIVSSSITGTSSPVQSGTGSTTYIGTNTSTGTLTVSNGVLVVGTSAGGNWAGSVVANGGILKGRGTITGNVTINSGATYSPGNSPGIQVVAGNLTINPGGSLLIEIDGATAGNGSGFYDQTQVGGTAAINGGTLQGFTIFSGSTNFVPQFGTKVTFLTAASVTGSFQAYDFSANGNGVSWMPEYRNTEVNLFAVPADFGNVSGFNSNQNSVGRALQSFRPAAIDARTVAGSSGVTATSDVGKIFNGLMRQDNSGLKTAYDQLSPEKLTAMSATVKQFGTISNSGTNQRLSQIRWGDRGVSLNGITLQTLDGDYENELLAVEKGAILVPKKKFSGKTGFFVNTTGSYSDVDSDERRIGYENRLGGITAGIDRELTKEITAGFFAGQGYADTKLGGGGGSVEANSGRIGIYGGYHKSGYYLNGSLGAGTTSFDTKRNIGFIGETASGSTQGYDLSGQIVGGVDFQTEEWVWGPIAKLDYGYQWIEKYNERGSAARLNLDSQAGASAETGAGMRVSRPFNYNGWKWIPELRLMGSHQWEKPNDIRAQFAAGGDAFTVHPEGAGQEMIIPGANLQLRFSETTSLNFGYEARVNLESCSHQLDLGLQTRF